MLVTKNLQSTAKLYSECLSVETVLLQVAAVIPAYKPSRALLELVPSLTQGRLAHVVVVDDGSGADYECLFSELKRLQGVTVLQHAVNLGKGAALKTGINFIGCSMPEATGVVTADADGQHHTNDILRVAEALEKYPETLVLGVREFNRDVPLRSRLGNQLTRKLTRAIIGWNLKDTQTGLRGIPRKLFPTLLRMNRAGYEFELDMLIAARHHKYEVLQISIQTIYLNGNQESHFNPMRDSLRIYFVLLRFSIVSMLTAIVDNLCFIGMYYLTHNILESQMLGRLCGAGFNYNLARRAVFLSREQHQIVLPKYVSLVIVSGILSYSLIHMLNKLLGLHVIPAKLTAETLLFLFNFCVQRDMIFRRRL